MSAGSDAVKAIEQVLRIIQRDHRDVPTPFVYLTNTPNWHAHILTGIWEGPNHEPLQALGFSGQLLGLSPSFVVTVLVHESAHLLANARGIQDTSNEGRWHNRRFVQLAEELGMKAPAVTDARHGYSFCTLRRPNLLKWDRAGGIIRDYQDKHGVSIPGGGE